MYIFLILTYYSIKNILELFKFKKETNEIKNSIFYSKLLFYLLIILFQFFTTFIILSFLQNSNIILNIVSTLFQAYVSVNFIIFYRFKILKELLSHS
jgi:hypothetical protein